MDPVLSERWVNSERHSGSWLLEFGLQISRFFAEHCDRPKAEGVALLCGLCTTSTITSASPFFIPLPYTTQDISTPVAKAERSRSWEDSPPMSTLVVHFFCRVLEDMRTPSQLTGWAGPVLCSQIVQGQLAWERKNLEVDVTRNFSFLVPLYHSRTLRA